jgi:hypothetical protein
VHPKDGKVVLAGLGGDREQEGVLAVLALLAHTNALVQVDHAFGFVRCP